MLSRGLTEQLTLVFLAHPLWGWEGWGREASSLSLRYILPPLSHNCRLTSSVAPCVFWIDSVRPLPPENTKLKRTCLAHHDDVRKIAGPTSLRRREKQQAPM